MIFPSAILLTLHPACGHTVENPLKSPAVGWVITTSSTMSPEPTGTSAVLANGAPGAAAAEDDDEDADAAGADESAVAVSSFELQAATAVARAPRPAPTMTVRRGGRRCSSMRWQSFSMGDHAGLRE